MQCGFPTIMNNDEPKREPSAFFKNQPPYTHFNKSFDDPADALYQQLNEVHPVFLNSEHPQKSCEYQLLLDPRNKEEIKKCVYDHTIQGQRYVESFRSVTPSKLNKIDHIKCLRVLQAWQEFSEVSEEDITRWRKLQSQRNEEKELFDKFVKEYSQTQKAKIYAPTERLVKLYKRYYAAKLKQLLSEYPDNLALNTHVGMPLPQSRETAFTKNMQMDNVRLVRRQGWVPVLKEYVVDLQRLNERLENCMDYFINSIEVESKSKSDVSFEPEQKMHQFYIPLESILFLLTAGSSLDLPTEVPLEIFHNEESDFKVIKFAEPLPPRNCGWFTHKYVVENAFLALMSASENTQLLYVENNTVRLQERSGAPEIEACKQLQKEYRVHEFNEYVQKFSSKPKESIKTNFAIVEWHLSAQADEKSKIQIFTELKLAPAKGVSGGQILSSLALKLEYKPQFGAEVMTKYELLNEWLRLKLLSECNGFTDHSLSMRIAVNNFSIQLEHNLMLSAVEKQLNELYQIQTSHLLAGLADSLHLLENMPKGRYFLRYNPKYPDKLLLSAPSTEITPNTVFLHNLLKVEPSDLLFVTNAPHLPISDMLCTVVHKKCKILPCAFKSYNSPQNNNGAQRNTYRKIRSDEECIQKRIKAKLAMKMKKEADGKRRQDMHKKKVKARKAVKRKKLAQDEIAKDQELEKLINEC